MPLGDYRIKPNKSLISNIGITKICIIISMYKRQTNAEYVGTTKIDNAIQEIYEKECIKEKL